ncbi:MAG: hypothetical protein NVSMB2_13070 [Chloroflexota bacterium]
MASPATPFLYASRPPSFRYFLEDALIALGLPYGPQARARLAAAVPELFGRSSATLIGYERRLEVSKRLDTLEEFSTFMAPRYRRWRG